MNRNDWIHAFNAALLSHFMITIADAGLDDQELHKWQQSFPSHPEPAALAFGERYDLEDVKRRHWY